MYTKLTAITLSCLAAVAFSAAAQAASFTADQISIPEKPEFMASLGIAKDAKPNLSKEQKRDLAQQAYQEKADQHFMSVHAQKGVSCISCHDPKAVKDVAWMATVGKPDIRQNCQDCHTVQAEVTAHTDTHDKLDCIACHMPNVASANDYSDDQNAAGPKALRRIHTYKINVDPKAASMVQGDIKIKNGTVKGYVLAKDEDGHGFVDLMWSCARNTPADYTVVEGKGCHNQATSKLDEGLVYQDQKEVYGETLKWQKPIKEGYKEVAGAIPRLRKLLEVTKLAPADQTEARLLLDKADDIAAMIKKDGSWGVHAQNYLLDRIQTAQAYLAKAQAIIDNGGYVKAAAK